MVASASETGSDQHCADLVTVQARGVGLIVQPRSAHLHRRGPVKQPLFDRVAIQARDRAQPPRDRRSRSAHLFELSSKAFDVVTGDIEQSELPLLAPRRKLAQIQAVGIASQSRVSAQKAEQRLLLYRTEDAVRATLQRQGWCDHLWFLSRRQEPEHRHGLELPHWLSARTYASLLHNPENSDSTERARSGHSALVGVVGKWRLARGG